jgi:hypothetical protein
MLNRGILNLLPFLEYGDSSPFSGRSLVAIVAFREIGVGFSEATIHAISLAGQQRPVNGYAVFLLG